jgi:hypothetical protein
MNLGLVERAAPLCLQPMQRKWESERPDHPMSSKNPNMCERYEPKLGRRRGNSKNTRRENPDQVKGFPLLTKRMKLVLPGNP